MDFNLVYLVNIGNNNSISAARIVAIWSMEMRGAAAYVQQARRTNTFFDMSGNKKLRSVILTDYGALFGSMYTALTLKSRINREIAQLTARTIDDAIPYLDNPVEDAEVVYGDVGDRLGSIGIG